MPRRAKAKSWSDRKPLAISAGIGVLLSVIGSFAYDYFAKPGLSSVGRWLLDVVTFQSDRLKDSVYSQAALDPNPIPTLAFLLLNTNAFAGGSAGMVVGATIAYWRYLRKSKSVAEPAKPNRKRKTASKNGVTHQTEPTKTPDTIQSISTPTEDHPTTKQTEDESNNDSVKEMENRKRRWLVTVLLGATILFHSLVVKTFNDMHNQSVLIWRVFNADMAICRPFLSDEKEKELRAAFCRMTTRKEYFAIRDELVKIATAHGIEGQLRKEKTW